MARLRLRDRFFTPPVARAITSPGGILLAGAGLAGGIVVGLPIIAAAGIGAVAWAARVAVAVPRGPRKERIDPFTLSEPWRGFVLEAQQARVQFTDAVKQAEAGPLRDRLATIGERVDTGLTESWRIARAGQALSEARARINVAEITRHLGEVGPLPVAPAPDSSQARTLDALNAQMATAKRMDEIIVDTRDRLRLLDARLDEAVTRAIELSVRASGAEDLGGLGDDVDSLVGDMEALRQALDETDRPGGTQTALPGPS